MLAKDERAAAARGAGCLGKAADEEPVFVLRAQDDAFLYVLQAWIDKATELGAPEAKLQDARDLWMKAARWQQENRTKVPD